MNRVEQQKDISPFSGLSPETVINLVEETLGLFCTNLFRPLNSYINRVFELEQEDGTGLIVKFYRPGRWSRSALLDEHEFLLDLSKLEIPVIAPLENREGRTLGQYADIFFAVFPKCGGRSFDEYNDDQWLELGRLLGRFHNVGAKKQLKDRVIISPELSTKAHIDAIMDSGLLPGDLKTEFQELTTALVDKITPFFQGFERIRIHGDCHFSNIIYRPGESFYLIDLDDMAMGPPVQDFWMLLPNYMEESLVEIDLFLEGYETFRRFDTKSLRLIEPLRAMRYLHYMAWLTYQVLQDGQTQVNTNFGTPHYWRTEMKDLYDQLDRISELDDHFANYY